MFALPISKPRFKTLFFNQTNSKMKLFLQKKCKIFKRWRPAPRPPCLRRLGALLLNPQPPAVGGFVLRAHWIQAAGGSAPGPQNSPPLRISGYAPDCTVNNGTPARCSSRVSKQQKSWSNWHGFMFSFMMSKATNTQTHKGYRTFGQSCKRTKFFRSEPGPNPKI